MPPNQPTSRASATPEVNYLQYLEVLRKRWGVILLSAAVIFTTVLLRTLNLPDFYVSTAKITFSASSPEQMDIYRRSGPAPDYTLYNPVFIKQQLEVLNSDRVLRKAVRQLGLLAAAEPDNSLIMLNQINYLRGLIRAEPVENSAIIRITVTSRSPEEAYRVTRAVSTTFVQDNLERQVEGYQKGLTWLTALKADLENKQQEAQQNLIHFVEKEKMTNFGSGKGEMAPPVSPEEEMASKLLSSLESEKLEAELRLARLSERYLDEHPKVIEAKADLQRVVSKIAEQGARLQALKHNRERQVIESKQKEIQYDILRSKVEINKEFANTLGRKLKDLDIGSAVLQNNASIIEEAKMPLRPAGPDKRRHILYGLIASLIFSISLAFFIDYLDNSVRSVEDVGQFLGIPVLAAIPYLKKVKTQEQEEESHYHFLAIGEEEAQLREAYRTLRTNLRFALPGQGSHSVLVTSTQKGEGKSTIAANYGLICAETGKKAIIVDCDLRLPNIHRIFNLPNERGLTNYLAEACEIGPLIQESGIPNLMILPSGPNPPKPTVLLESDNMIQLIPILEDDFDYVILDAPPVGMVIDTSVIAGLARAIIMVIEAGITNRYHVIRALEQLEKSRANVAGAVLNKLRFKKRQYLDYYGYYYNYGEKKPPQTP